MEREQTEEAIEVDIKELEKSLVNDKRDRNLPNIKRMLSTLDKFLDRRIAGVAVFFMALLIACGTGLIINGSNVYASTGGDTTINNTSVWLYSVLGVVAFLFTVVLARVFVLRMRRRNTVTGSDDIGV